MYVHGRASRVFRGDFGYSALRSNEDTFIEKGRTVPKRPMPDAVAEFLAEPNYATIASLKADGQPVSVPTWYMFENGRILVNMDESRKRLGYLRNDPRVSLSAMDPDDWVTHVSIQGRVVEFVDDPSHTDIDRIARHYTGKPYYDREGKRISAWIEIDRWHAWGRLHDA